LFVSALRLVEELSVLIHFFFFLKNKKGRGSRRGSLKKTADAYLIWKQGKNMCRFILKMNFIILLLFFKNILRENSGLILWKRTKYSSKLTIHGSQLSMLCNRESASK